jgi:hypothetical protein
MISLHTGYSTDQSAVDNEHAGHVIADQPNLAVAPSSLHLQFPPCREDYLSSKKSPSSVVEVRAPTACSQLPTASELLVFLLLLEHGNVSSAGQDCASCIMNLPPSLRHFVCSPPLAMRCAILSSSFSLAVDERVLAVLKLLLPYTFSRLSQARVSGYVLPVSRSFLRKRSTAVVSEARVSAGEEDCVVRDFRMLLGSFVEGVIRPIVVPQSVTGNLLAQQQAVFSSLLLSP